jgi:D-alanyl-D-alanine carboxypeptidase
MTKAMALSRRSQVIKYTVFGALFVALACTAFFLFKTTALSVEIANLKKDLATMTSERDALTVSHASSTLALTEAQNTIEALAEELSLTADELDELEDDYRKEKNKNDDFQDQIKDIAGTVSDLDKLSKTDEELLQKYSKVYFLNEHYVPEQITEIEKKYLYNENISKSAHSKVEPYLTEMLDDALADGVKIWVVSAYRSFYEQASLKGSYTVTYGSGANTFSADQGYSEHQLGTTFDFTTEGIGGGLVSSFEATPAFAWLQKNAHKYGFTLSYPKNNAYYVYEPWHWRFVGEDLAEDLKEDNASFYDWDQRKIDAYLIKIFD